MEEAEEILNHLSQSHPDSFEIYILFAELELKRKNSNSARRFIDQAVAIKEKRALLRDLYGHMTLFMYISKPK